MSHQKLGIASSQNKEAANLSSRAFAQISNSKNMSKYPQNCNISICPYLFLSSKKDLVATKEHSAAGAHQAGSGNINYCLSYYI